MPLFYSIEGRLSPYAIEPVTAIARPHPAPRAGSQEAEQRENLNQESFLRHPDAAHYGTHLQNSHDTVTHIRKKAITAQDIMTPKVYCIQSNLLVTDAEKVFQTKKFRHLPVISEEGQLIGILSDRDLIRVDTGNPQLVTSIMSKKVLTATGETPIQTIAESLLNNRISALPIVNQDHHVIGILTTTDILRAIMTHAPIDLWV